MNTIFKHIKNYKKYIALTILLICIQTLLNFIGPLVIKEILTNVEINEESNILLYFIIFFVALISIYIIKIISSYVYTRFSLRFKVNESKNMYNNLFETKFSYINKFEPSYFITRIKQGVDNLFNLLGDKVSRAAIAILTIIISLYFVANVSVYLVILFIILSLLNFYGYKSINNKLKEDSSKLQKTCADNFKNIINVVQNIEQIKQIGQYSGFVNMIGKYVFKIEKENNNIILKSNIVSIILGFIIDIIKNSVLLLSIYLYFRKQISFADIVFINMILSIYFSALTDLKNINISLRDVRASMKFINEELLNNLEDNTSKIKLEKINDVKFDINKFSYDSKKVVLEDIYFKITENDKVGLVGESGSGKSTLIKLLLNLYDFNDIYINGIPMVEYNLKSIRRKIYVVSQNTYMFPGSIKDNIVIGIDDYDESKLNEILEYSFLEPFKSLPEGMDTLIREKGLNFSGGQKQKIVIARMLMYDPDIIVFDESTSALDSNSEDTIFEDINDYLNNKIVIKVSHRLSSLNDLNYMVVLKDGRIEAMGDHEHLMKNSEEYKRLFSKQLSND
ncbi:ABC transporter ATP-binding protein [Vallitalea longa]|uniref:ABC transporter ATP-binding protein n=1 Tax=Vallitalea longa TaxID=2936439 RepID=A0A9W5Y8E8_9FIRM|nr:ABC transporter ATP-binding protein [Vallitalea longa]GKX27638.1 ABC transporter ATP-binding protein [Vallitalea longa]